VNRPSLARVARWRVLLVCLLVVATAFPAEPASVTGRAMGTDWVVKWVQPARPLAPEEVAARVAARLEALEQHFSTYRPGSALMRFNVSAGMEWWAVPAELAAAGREAAELSALTGGAFDVTVQPLVELWGFGPRRREGPLPSPAEIGAARARVGWRFLEARAEPPALRRTRPGVAADFSSLAKGWAADAASHVLAGLGAPNHLVRIAGDFRSAGQGPEGRGWRLGVEKAWADGSGLATVVALRGEALSTSGDYRNFFVREGRRYGHIIDPRTGEPVAGELAAVSVIASTCARSSALATALFVLGPEEGRRLAEAEGWACLFQVRRDGALESRVTPAWARHAP
jgi:thiamine biosynthesis lipoprotein